MDLLDLCDKYYGTRDLYRVLCSSKTASNLKLHKAYKAISLIIHPDQNEQSNHATEKFKVLKMVHDFLLSEKNRKMYDECGRVGPPVAITVSDEEYEECKRLFEGSEREREMIRIAYINCKGSINAVMANIPFLRPSDRPRIIAVIDDISKSVIVPNVQPPRKRNAKSANLDAEETSKAKIKKRY